MEKNKYIKPSMIQISRLRKVYRLEDEEVVALHSVLRFWKKYFAESARRNGEAHIRRGADRKN